MVADIVDAVYVPLCGGVLSVIVLLCIMQLEKVVGVLH